MEDTIIIVDDEPIARTRYPSLSGEHNGIEVVGEAANE